MRMQKKKYHSMRNPKNGNTIILADDGKGKINKEEYK